MGISRAQLEINNELIVDLLAEMLLRLEGRQLGPSRSSTPLRSGLLCLGERKLGPSASGSSTSSQQQIWFSLFQISREIHYLQQSVMWVSVGLALGPTVDAKCFTVYEIVPYLVLAPVVLEPVLIRNLQGELRDRGGVPGTEPPTPKSILESYVFREMMWVRERESETLVV